MQLALSYVLLLTKQPHRLRVLVSLLRRLNCVVAIATSEEQAISQTIHNPPFLIILAGDHQHWSEALLPQLRIHAKTHHITLIALTEFNAPSWIYQEENPGFDGFLVNPITSDVLSSLVESAYTRQIYCPVG